MPSRRGIPIKIMEEAIVELAHPNAADIDIGSASHYVAVPPDRDDATGACAYPPGLLLKVLLFAYRQGIVSSRGIERACREHITFIALSGEHSALHDEVPPSSPAWATKSQALR